MKKDFESFKSFCKDKGLNENDANSLDLFMKNRVFVSDMGVFYLESDEELDLRYSEYNGSYYNNNSYVVELLEEVK